MQVEAVQLHDLDPSVDEVAGELLPRVVRGVHLGDGAQLGVRTEDQVGAATGEGGTGRGVLAVVEVALAALPGGLQVQQRDQEVVGQRTLASVSTPTLEPAVAACQAMRIMNGA